MHLQVNFNRLEDRVVALEARLDPIYHTRMQRDVVSEDNRIMFTRELCP